MSQVDLSQLAVDRSPSTRPAMNGPARRWLSRYILPSTIVAAFLGLLAWAARDSLLPAKPVQIVPVLVARAEVQQTGAPLFQAAGWIEPRPVPTVVSSIAEGIVEQLHVVEGQQVAKGDVIAHLLDIDARIQLREAHAQLQLRKAKLTGAQAELENARLAFENPNQLRVELAESESVLLQLDADLDTLPLEIEAADTRWTLASENVENKEVAGSALAGKMLREAKADVATKKVTLNSLQGRRPLMVRQREALKAKRDALVQRLQLRLEHRSRISDALNAVNVAEAEVAGAELAVEVAELQLQRMTVLSPIDGRILSIETPPGKRVNGIDPHSERGSSAVVTMYDPTMLQVRVDVRLEDVPLVQLGQTVTVQTAAAARGLDGKVISVTSAADIQKNTLQVKVAILDPPELIRPEMLSQVTFLAPKMPASEQEDSQKRLKLLIPRQLVIGGEHGATIWVADRTTSTAAKRVITLGSAGTAELVEVASGLNPTDKLISSGVEGMSDGQRIRITTEDATLGSRSASYNITPRTASKLDISEVK